MDQSFERELKKKLEGQLPEDLGHSLDRERLWQQVSGKASKRKTLALPSWASHAAAVAAGLLIGILLLSRSKTPEAPAVIVKYAPAAPPARTITDTVYLPQPVAITSTLPVKTRTAAKTNPEPAPVSQPEKQPAIQVPDMRQTVQEQPALASAALLPQQPKVMHLSDMNNENAIPKRMTKRPLIQLSNQNQAEGNTETLVAKAYRKIIPIKN